MRHRVRTKRLGRFSSLRKATIRSLIRALILHQSIKTTYTKAKIAAPEMEKLISLAKEGTLNAKRKAYGKLSDHRLVVKLFGEVAELFKDRQSGFTRILKLNKRRGDGAQLVLLEFTDKVKKEKKAKKEKERAKTKDAAKEQDNVPPQAEEKAGKEKAREQKAQKKKEEKAKPPAAEKKELPEGKEELDKEEIKEKELKKEETQKEKKPPGKFLKGLRDFLKKGKEKNPQ